jgi:hypothetical protein
VPGGYALLASCCNCRHYVEVMPPEGEYESASPACNLDNSKPCDLDAWYPWSINYEVVKHGWCPNYEALPWGEELLRRKEEDEGKELKLR